MGEREVMPAARIWGLGRGSRFAEISRFLEKDKRRKPDYDDDIDIVSLGDRRGRSVGAIFRVFKRSQKMRLSSVYPVSFC